MSDDYKDLPPWWPSRNNKPLRKIAGWMAIGVIGGGAFQILIMWVFDLVMDRLIGPVWARNHSDSWWTFLLGASYGGLLVGGVIALSWWRTRPLS